MNPDHLISLMQQRVKKTKQSRLPLNPYKIRFEHLLGTHVYQTALEAILEHAGFSLRYTPAGYTYINADKRTFLKALEFANSHAFKMAMALSKGEHTDEN